MRILIIGGTGLTGPHIVRALASHGHEVAVFHRGNTSAELPHGVHEMLGDTTNLSSHRDAFEAFRPDVVLGMMVLTRADAEQFVAVFSGLAGRAVVVSSADVYLAFGRLHHSEPGPLIQGPLTEGSPLRTKVSLGGEGYDKIAVEAVIRNQTKLSTTIIRYPAVYGPGDGQRRLYEEVRRMSDRRPAILLPESLASMRFSHGYSENVAQAVVLSALREGVAGEVFNVAEAETPTQKERIEQLGQVLGWHGQVVVVADDSIASVHEQLKSLPGYGGPPDYRQHLALDSSRIRVELGYNERVSMAEGLRRTTDWLLAHPPPGWEENYDHEDAVLASFEAPREDASRR